MHRDTGPRANLIWAPETPHGGHGNPPKGHGRYLKKAIFLLFELSRHKIFILGYLAQFWNLNTSGLDLVRLQ